MYTLNQPPSPQEFKAVKNDHGQTYGDIADMTLSSISGVKKWALGIRPMPVGLWQLWLLKLGEVELEDCDQSR